MSYNHLTYGMTEPQRDEFKRLIKSHNETVGLLQTIVAGLVWAHSEHAPGGEVRIPLHIMEEPPEIEADDDPITGDWIYRLAQDGEEN